MFEHHANEVDSIELLLRRGIMIREGCEEGTRSDFNLYITGKGADTSLFIRHMENRSTSCCDNNKDVCQDRHAYDTTRHCRGKVYALLTCLLPARLNSYNSVKQYIYLALLEINLRDIAAINFSAPNDDCASYSSLYYPLLHQYDHDTDSNNVCYLEVTSFVIIYCSAMCSSVHVACETSSTCKDLVLSLRLVISLIPLALALICD